MAPKALVIDDEEDYRLLIADILKSGEIETRTAGDGLEGLTALESYSPDVILVDWMMPNLDGEGFCMALRRDGRFSQIPVVMLSLKKSSDEKRQAMAFGVTEFIGKPFQPEELLSRVRAALKRDALGA